MKIFAYSLLTLGVLVFLAGLSLIWNSMFLEGAVAVLAGLFFSFLVLSIIRDIKVREKIGLND